MTCWLVWRLTGKDNVTPAIDGMIPSGCQSSMLHAVLFNGDPMRTLQVALAERSYPIHIGAGLLDTFPIAEQVRGNQVMIITNETIAPLYLERLEFDPNDSCYSCTNNIPS